MKRSSRAARVVPAQEPVRLISASLACNGILLAGVLAVYWPICSHDFVSLDDYLHLHHNPHLNPPSLAGLRRLWTESYRSEYVPLSYTLYAIETWLGQLPPEEYGGRRIDPAIFHATSVVLHTLTTLALFLLLRAIVGSTSNWPSSAWAACAGAACFALHPLQVESVAWISETRGLLAGFFSVLALWQYWQFIKDRAKRRHYAAATLLFLLALLSKTSAAPIPLIAFILDWGLMGNPWRRALAWTLPWFVMSAIFAILMKSLQTDARIDFITPLWARPLIAGDAINFYLVKLFVPWDLAIHYDRHPRTVMSSPVLLAAGTIPYLLAGVLYVCRRQRMWWIAAAIFAAAVTPVLGLTPFLFQNYSTVADRYAYLALLGPAVGLSVLLGRHPSRVFMAAASIVLVVWGLLSHFQARHWRDSMTLYRHALEVNPGSHLVHTNLATDYLHAGDYAAALPHAEAAVQSQPASPDAKLLRAMALSGSNRIDEAIAQYEEILKRDARFRLARLNLGVLYYRQGRVEEAIAEYRTLLEASPNDADAHRKLGALLAAEGRIKEALPYLSRAVELEPSSPASLAEFAMALASDGRAQDAVKHYRAALAQRPPDWPLVADRLARLLATHPDSRVRDGSEALQLSSAVCRQTDDSVPELLQTLAAAYAELQRFDDATKTAQKALSRTATADKASLRKELEENLALYRQQQPWRLDPRTQIKKP